MKLRVHLWLLVTWTGSYLWRIFFVVIVFLVVAGSAGRRKERFYHHYIAQIWGSQFQGSVIAPILKQPLPLPSLNSHNSAPWSPNDLNSFPKARPLTGLGDRHWKCSKSPFLARVIRVQSCCISLEYAKSFIDTVLHCSVFKSLSDRDILFSAINQN